jgi:hypothetical protein
MKLKTILRKMLLIMSIILFLLFYIAGLICVIDAYFASFFTFFFSYLDSIGLTTTVILVIEWSSFIVGFLLYSLYERL